MIYEGDPIPEGFIPGRKSLSKDTRLKMLGKRRVTNLERYGVENAFQLEKVRNSRIYNNGVENIRICQGDPIPEGFIPGMKPLSDEERERLVSSLRKSCLEKYGVENPSQSEEIKEKKKRTTIEHYGVENPFQSEEIKEKIKQTNLQKYGVENPSQSEEIKKVVITTNLKKYGTEYPSQSKNIRELIKKRFVELYGVENPAQSEIVKDKIKNTNIERHGVYWTCMLPECRKPSTNDSEPNKEFAFLLNSENMTYKREFHIKHYSYDFKVGNTLIELDPYPYHNTIWCPVGIPKSPDYHQKKSHTAEGEGYQVIHIFDWDDKSKIIDLLLQRETVYARKTELHEVSYEDCTKFLMENHLQGSCRGQDIRIGLYLNEELISIMTFGKPRYNKNYQYELLRYCSSKNVIGGAQKLFTHFIREFNPESIISYCDRSKFRGDVYQKLGFTLLTGGKPSCHWYSPKENRHITDNFLRQRGYDQIFNESYGKGTSNEELIIKRGYYPIYDCGQDTYTFKK